MHFASDWGRGDSAGGPEWMTPLAVVILFATLGLGGLFWWPLFVGAVLVAGMASFGYSLSLKKER